MSLAELRRTRDSIRPRGRPPRRGRWLRRLAVALPFVAPSLIGVVLFLLVPVVIVLVLSLFRWNFLQPPRWVGLGNFVTMVRNDHVPHGWRSPRTTTTCC